MLDIEHCSSANGSKVPHEKRILEVPTHFRHELVRDEDGRDAPEDQNEASEAGQPDDSDATGKWLVELGPGHDGTDVHETGVVE
jgi:hypothetical protein